MACIVLVIIHPVDIIKLKTIEREVSLLKREQDYFRGCLLGGAIGDALGWPVEFLQYDEVLSKYGEGGIRDLDLNGNSTAQITDDTQMTLFTAEGILRTETRINEQEICDAPSMVYFAYLRWLNTQGYPKVEELDWIYDGWLIGIKELHNKRAPGNTCLTALLSGEIGSMDNPLNNSKGCGGVMRTAPAGLFFSKEEAFRAAADFAALTHGHPSGYLSAGALAFIIASIIEGEDIVTAAQNSLGELVKYKGHEECTEAVKRAIELSHSSLKPLEAIEKLGEGWVGEEALAISLYCALKYKNNFKMALISAVNHNGDSDSTGAITGNILGAYLGVNAIPQDWIEKVELRDVLIGVADDLLLGYETGKPWWNRYPGY